MASAHRRGIPACSGDVVLHALCCLLLFLSVMYLG